MRFRNREDAGQQLADYLCAYARDKDLVVLGIPRGGVPVAFEIARKLHAPLDVFLSRKLGVPGQEELAFGALTADDGRFLDEAIVRATGVSAEQIEQITEAARRKIEERAALYRHGRLSLNLEGKTIILVDDGIATGSSIYVAIRALRATGPKEIIVAAPVAPPLAYERLRREADALITLFSPESFSGVGQFYQDFRQTSDREVIDLLARQNTSSSNEQSEAAENHSPSQT